MKLIPGVYISCWKLARTSSGLIYGAVVLRKNLSKCVISPLMEHRREPIILIPLPLSLSFSLPHSLSLVPFLSLPDYCPLPNSCSLLFMLLDVSISLLPLHLSILFFLSFKEWLSSCTIFGDCDCVTVCLVVCVGGIYWLTWEVLWVMMFKGLMEPALLVLLVWVIGRREGDGLPSMQTGGCA